jgi:hypothetical protein
MPSNNNINRHVIPLHAAQNNTKNGSCKLEYHNDTDESVTAIEVSQSNSRYEQWQLGDTADFGSINQHNGNASNIRYQTTHYPQEPKYNHCCQYNNFQHHHERDNSYNSNNHNIINQLPTRVIDNRQLVYIPIRLSVGVCVYCSPEVLSSCPMVLQSLQADLTRVLKVLPVSVHGLVQRTNLWVNATYAYGDRNDPQILRHLTTHHEEGWLVECARDTPQKARDIEIYSCYDFQRMRLHWNGSGLLLHEFCHLIHQFCLHEGLENTQVAELYKTARSSGRYDQVLRRDWAGMEEDFDMAYAMVDKKEFFAEMSVAFLCDGYHSLSKADHNIMEDCSPPLLHPVVTERVMIQHGITENPLDNDGSDLHPTSCWTLFRGIRRAKPKVRMVDPIFSEAAMSRCCVNVQHCNKFYPFTRGQLRYYDPELLCGIRALWREISMWDDPRKARSQSCCGP